MADDLRHLLTDLANRGRVPLTVPSAEAAPDPRFLRFLEKAEGGSGLRFEPPRAPTRFARVHASEADSGTGLPSDLGRIESFSWQCGCEMEG